MLSDKDTTTTTPQSRGSMEKSSNASHAEGGLTGEIHVVSTAQELHREMTIRTLLMLGFGGGIGTALFVSIGGALHSAGPLNLLLGFIAYNVFALANINNSMAEMNCYMPISGGFIRLAGHWVDDALGFAGGWNFYIYLGVIVPFEITALSFILSYWSDNIPIGAICAGSIVIYIAVNIFAVGIYGEAEFWLCLLKVLLMVILMAFTLVTMSGGNPLKDAYGFRHWNEPAPLLEFMSTGDAGRFEGFLTALWFAAFTCVGPEFLSMAAGEVKHPRTYLKSGHKSHFVRIAVFYIGGPLAVSIIISARDPVLARLYTAGGNTGSASASPYIIAMDNLRVTGLPHLVTALFATTIFAAGNTVLYSATRCLYGLALEGRAPRFLRKVNKKGVPIYAFAVTMVFPLLALLQLGSGAAKVLTWLINVATGATLLYFMTALITYIRFHRACVVQGFDRSRLPWKGRFQPYGAWIALVVETIITIFYGYRSVVPFSVDGFITAYFMPVFVPCLFVGWKLIKKTKFVRAKDLDLVWEAPLIDAYEASTEDAPVGFWRDVLLMFKGYGLKKRTDAAAEA